MSIGSLAISLLLETLLAAAAAAAPASATVMKLAPGAELLGVTRRPVAELVDGRTTASPAVAITPAGEVFSAAIVVDSGRERVFVQRAASPEAALGRPRPVSNGFRAWHPRLAAGADGSVWLAWCGLDSRPRSVSYARNVFLKKLRPGKPGPRLVVSQTAGRAANPELAVDKDGVVHLVWENSPAADPSAARIAYRVIGPDGRPRGDMTIVSTGPFDRRPAVAVAGDGRTIFVAWDSLEDTRPSGAVDPDYDVWLRRITRSGMSKPILVDGRDGIQAAPNLAAEPGGGVLVAYHAGLSGGLVKRWSLRRVRRKTVERLAAVDTVSQGRPSDEMQGAEFPALALLPDGRALVASRPSQGAYLEIVSGDRISAVLDLTRRGWGARGRRAVLAAAPDGTLLLARRARQSAVLERFEIAAARPSILAFTPVADPPKTERPAIKPLRLAPAAAGTLLSGKSVLFGDIHMHSAASDGAGCQDEVLARAWLRGYAFAALSDHDYIVGSPMFPSKFDEMAWVTDAFDARPDFSTLHAFEWTTPPLPRGSGHRNVYFRGPAPVDLPGFRNGCPDTKALLKALRGKQAIVIPHHTSWTGTDWDNFDPLLQPQFEIVSLHGVSEYPGNRPIPPRPAAEGHGAFAVDGLGRGLAFGFVGGSDGHGLLWHHGIARHRDPWTCGLTGVLADGDTRAQIFDAMRARRTEASSGKPLLALISAGGLAMGQTGRVRAPVEIEFYARGKRNLDSVSLVRDGKVVERREPDSPECKGRWTDRTAIAGRHYYYLRAQQGRGKAAADLAWSSPVFVTIEQGRK